MRRFLPYLFALTAMVMVACENNNSLPDSTVDPIFTIVDGEVHNVGAEGDTVTVHYFIENTIPGEEVVWEILNTTMITAVDGSAKGVIEIAVAPNPTAEEREGSVVLSYAGHNKNITIKQAAGEEPANSVGFTLLDSATQSVEAEGGNIMVRYNIAMPIEGETVECTILNTVMIPEVNYSIDGVVMIEVAPNSELEPRTGEVILAYADVEYTITITQAAAAYREVDIAANQLIGTYYGERVTEGLGNYWLIFSKDGVEGGDVQPNTEFIRLDILAPLATSEERVKVPDGTYRFDASNSCGNYSILNLPNTDYMYVDENLEGWTTQLVGASMTVAGNHIELVAYTETAQFNVTFDGDYSLDVAKTSDHISNLKGDVAIDVSNCNVSIKSYGDYWHCGYCNWVVEFVDKKGYDNGVFLQLDLLGTTVDASSGYVGLYPSAGFSADDPSKPNFGPGVFIPGVAISDDGIYLMGSLYMVYNDNNKAVTQAPLTTGTVEIKKNTDGTHTIIVDAYDDAPEPNKLTLNWTGNVQ
ncbi:MAG: BACON domain-containing protein [Alistipes sp.]|nr:BACON domain-containing protein [Alistipes sp.]